VANEMSTSALIEVASEVLFAPQSVERFMYRALRKTNGASETETEGVALQ
jgi:hypothetical protein